MSRPLLISDCDDVLLHFAPHFAAWVAEAHGFTFVVRRPSFAGALPDETGVEADRERAWPLARRLLRRARCTGSTWCRRARRAAGDRRARPTSSSSPISATSTAPIASRSSTARHSPPRARNQGGKGRPVAELIARCGRAPPCSSTICRSTTNRCEARARGLAAAHDRRAAHCRDHPARAARPCPDRRLADALPWIMDRSEEGAAA